MTTICEGTLLKMGGGAFSRLQKRHFVLIDKQLHYYDERGAATPKGTIDLDGAKVVFRGTHLDHMCFSIEGINAAKGIKEYFLYTDSPDDRWRWLSAIMHATGRYNFTAASASDEARIEQSPLIEELRKPHNTTCADCGSHRPTWSVLAPFGTFVCIECVGVHRALWAPKCREVQLDEWPPEDLAYFAGRGNAIGNAELEYHVPAGVKKPCSTSENALRKSFIELKYVRLAFTRENNVDQPPQAAVQDVVSSAPVAYSPLNGPPKFIGVAFVMTHSMSGLSSEAIAVLTNGFQEVRSPKGRKSSAGTEWNVPLQIGLDNLLRPLYFTIITNGDQITGTAEIVLPPKATDEDCELYVPVSGKGLTGAMMKLTVHFTKLA